MIKIKSVEKNSTSYKIISNIEKDKICKNLRDLKKELKKLRKEKKNWRKDYE